jgi:hypothetical protein
MEDSTSVALFELVHLNSFRKYDSTILLPLAYNIEELIDSTRSCHLYHKYTSPQLPHIKSFQTHLDRLKSLLHDGQLTADALSVDEG